MYGLNSSYVSQHSFSRFVPVFGTHFSHRTYSLLISSARSMTTDYKFQGWLGHDSKSVDGNMRWGPYEPKTWSEEDVDIKISHCGICGSDLHTLRSGWKPTDYPCCVGHEIVGRAVKVGSKAERGIMSVLPDEVILKLELTVCYSELEIVSASELSPLHASSQTVSNAPTEKRTIARSVR